MMRSTGRCWALFARTSAIPTAFLRTRDQLTRDTCGGADGPPAGGPSAPDMRSGRSGDDGLLGVAAGDLDAAGFSRLADRDGQGQYPGRVVGGDMLGVEGLA